MPGSCEQFAQAIVTAGMLSAEAMQSFWAALPAANRPATADDLAAALVRAGRITPFQAKHLLGSLAGPSFGPTFPARSPDGLPPTAILPGGSVVPVAVQAPVVVVAPPHRENLLLKILGGAFVTIIAPLLVTMLVNRLDDRPAPVVAPVPQVPAPVAASPTPAATTEVAKSVPRPIEEPVKQPPAPADSVPASGATASVSPAPPLKDAAEPKIAEHKSSEPKSTGPEPPAKPVRPKSLPWPSDLKGAKASQHDWAKFLKVPSETKNSLGMKLALIPPGTFSMGNTPKRAMQVARVLKQASELERIRDELPQHRVTFSKAWLLGTTEVTIGQFGHFVAATNYVTEGEQVANSSKSEAARHAPTWRAPGYPVTDEFPVTHVSWNDAVAFCNWLSATEKLKPCYRNGKDGWARAVGGDGYRLPTEAEWEYGCRAGASTEFYFGDDPDRLEPNGWCADNSEQSAHAVGVKRANGFGLHDVSGNAREWCEDWYAADYYAESSPVDPRGPSSGSLRVTRGGSWYSPAARARNGDRAGTAPTYHSNQFGFRVMRPL